jgi:bifunctional UDP-N-acetylglucosamine pyrophosphorylase / glucosamine-1-phosphate N-acetyltransferase
VGSKRTSPKLAAIVLAAGRSTRFKTSTPKVLHPVAGRTLLGHVLGSLRELHRTHKLQRVVIVVPPGGAVEAALDGAKLPFEIGFAVQKQPKGTGDAARIGLAALDGASDEVLAVAGDMPLIEPATLGALIDGRRNSGAAGSLLFAALPYENTLGRVVRKRGKVAAIVEVRDATPAQLKIDDANASIYAFDRGALADALPRLSSANAQGELYLTDVVGILVGSGSDVVAVEAAPEEVVGMNTRAEQAQIAGLIRARTLRRLMDQGVSVVDPGTTYVDADVAVGADTVLLPNTLLEGDTRIGAGCEIGPNVRLVDTVVGEGAIVTFASARGSKIGPGAEVGPYASLRAGTVLHAGAKAGTFVEMKKAEVGEGAKVPHLSYMGDVKIGRGTNIGAGSITCNWDPTKPAPDGGTKHRTVIGEDAYISSDTMFVAPVRVGNRAQTGAGSVVTRNVKDDELVYGVPAQPRGKSRVKKTAAKKKASTKKASKRPSSGKKKGKT